MSDTITLGGRKFRPCTNSTLQHDIVSMNYTRAAGLIDVEVPEDADPFTVMSALTAKLAMSNNFYQLLGCLLIPADKEGLDWTPDMCADTAAHLRGLTDGEDRQQLLSLVADLLINFFQTGLASLKIIPKSSVTNESP